MMSSAENRPLLFAGCVTITRFATIFRVQVEPATVFGLLGEGTLPAADLAQSVASVEQALDGSVSPTAITPRSQSKSRAGFPPQWLPDSFVSQVWCNDLFFTAAGLGLDNESVGESTLLSLLPRLLTARQTEEDASGFALVDGTQAMGAVFASEGYEDLPGLAGNAVSGNNGTSFFGRLGLALLPGERSGEVNLDGKATIGEALWPPAYVLEHVATDEGLVLVNSVNCGYLDFAVNFVRAAGKVVDNIKVHAYNPTNTALTFDVGYRNPRCECRLSLCAWS